MHAHAHAHVHLLLSLLSCVALLLSRCLHLPVTYTYMCRNLTLYKTVYTRLFL
jgi:hypothetical protein